MRRELTVSNVSGPATLIFDGNQVASISRSWDLVESHYFWAAKSVPSWFLAGKNVSYDSDTGFRDGTTDVMDAAARVDVVTVEQPDPGDPTRVSTSTERLGRDSEGTLLWRDFQDFDGTRSFDVYKIGSDGGPVLWTSTQVDPENVHDWALREVEYGAWNDVRVISRVVMDNGLHQETYLGAGGSTILATNMIDFGDVREGRTEFVWYYPSGDVHRLETLSDEGILTRTEPSSSGLPWYWEIRDLEDTETWVRIHQAVDRRFDVAGNPDLTNGWIYAGGIELDNGGYMQFDSTFGPDGTLLGIYIGGYDKDLIDLPFFEGRSWLDDLPDLDLQSIKIQYDEAGEVRSKWIELKNHIEIDEYYESGDLIERRTYDSYDNISPWRYIAEDYDGNGEISDRETVWDDGLVTREWYENGRLSRKYSDDDAWGTGGSTRPWRYIAEDYDRNGEISDRETVWDDGLVTREWYENGRLSRKYSDDDYWGTGVSTRPWRYIAEDYDGNGEISDRETVWDDGLVTWERYEAGRLSTAVTEDRADAHPWDWLSHEYDADGTLILTGLGHDDGRIRWTTHKDGIRVSSKETDTADAHDWETISEAYRADGSLALRVMTHDNGVVQPLDFRASDYETFDDPEDLSFRETVWDDGRFTTERYEAGQLSTAVTEDRADARPWDWLSHEYDAGGTLILTGLGHDDGRIRWTTHKDGIRVSSKETDTADAHDWETISEAYRADGSLALRVMTHDNGVVQTLDFHASDGAGWRDNLREDLADVFVWTEHRVTVVDGDRHVSVLYDTGVLVETRPTEGGDWRRMEDTADIFVWSEVVTSALDGPDGPRSVTLKTFDSGLVERSVRDADGTLLRTTLYDLGDAHDWQSHDRILFEDGTPYRTRTVLDDGRATEVIFDATGAVQAAVWSAPALSDLTAF